VDQEELASSSFLQGLGRRKSDQTTLADIAEALGLATSTVSRALKNSGEINPSTRQAIAALAQQLNYQPNLVAKSLQSNETKSGGVIVPEPPDAIFAIRYTGAFTIMADLKRRGIPIPQQVAVVGFGDELLATMIEPSLTTVDLHLHCIGQQATYLFLEQVAQPEHFQLRTCVVPSEVIIRQSSRKGRGELFRLSI
jgi:DNA-binding LacI/PurR family transcriptional regulator